MQYIYIYDVTVSPVISVNKEQYNTIKILCTNKAQIIGDNISQ